MKYKYILYIFYIYGILMSGSYTFQNFMVNIGNDRVVLNVNWIS